MRVLFFQNRVEILLHDEEIEKLHKGMVNKINEPIMMRDFSPNDGRALLLRRDDYQPKIEDKFKLKDKERKAMWMLTRENERINKETREESDAVKKEEPQKAVKRPRIPDSLKNRWPTR